MIKHESLNVYHEPLESCCEDPLTGFFRDGCCNTADEDLGMHTVCVELTDDFLQFSKRMGNDLITPRPEFNFPGLKAGDRWCLCASRWLQSHQAGVAPRVHIRSTHQRTLEIVDLQLLKQYAADLQ
ncbi:DUF2237 domain-containing protein [Marinicella sp. S1101]|uniref:DUF2237 family protein n=1 Tax=Marinicella marina TaxID=2996016 RepID=UPI002260E0EB|nr:DUF2237 domain-containing protein [Marinicella marina]MCX7552600.1 DUF2237 domain-containing protein [Marinicella marina]MDJ1139476.1 DUF2237 domain-containing protein [Marinicella marina]